MNNSNQSVLKDIKCQIVKGIGKTSKKVYYALNVDITPTYSKTIFLESADNEIIKLYYDKSALTSDNK